MLQMPVLKLEQVLRHELSTNPMLEEVEALEQVDDPDSPEETPEPQEAESEKKDDFDWESYFDEGSEFVPKGFSEKAEDTWERTTVVETTLYDHLTEQLKLSKLHEEDVEIGEFIIGNLDAAGLLTMSVEELAEALKTPVESVVKVLKAIQGFDPPGVGARDLRESLLIQLDLKGLADSLSARVVAEHWHELDRKTHMQLARSLGVPIERVREAMDELRTLSPRPAQGRFTTPAVPVVPDLVVDRIDGEYLVYHNDRNLPRLRVTSAYKDIMRRGSKSPVETKKYVRDKLEQARWLLNAINQRRSTMTKVMEAIIEEQKEFFEKGPNFLKPLRMGDIADKVGMNVATVSRVSKEKYVQTPQGVREIKSFFTGGVEMAEGEAMSKRNVKTRISELITAENLASPLSDQEIYKKLQAEGIRLARRTVTKYREELKLPSARFRKKIFGQPTKKKSEAERESAAAVIPPDTRIRDTEIGDDSADENLFTHPATETHDQGQAAHGKPADHPGPADPLARRSY
jgi:RNA polymerase sigma-54 factor